LLHAGHQKNISEALSWYTSAAKSGVKESEQELYRLEARDSAGELLLVLCLDFALRWTTLFTVY